MASPVLMSSQRKIDMPLLSLYRIKLIALWKSDDGI